MKRKESHFHIHIGEPIKSDVANSIPQQTFVIDSLRAELIFFTIVGSNTTSNPRDDNVYLVLDNHTLVIYNGLLNSLFAIQLLIQVSIIGD